MSQSRKSVSVSNKQHFLLSAGWREVGLIHLFSDSLSIDCKLMKRNFMLSDTSQQSMIQHTLRHTQSHTESARYPPPLLDEVIIAGRESPCIDRPFSTRAPHTYI